MTSKWARFIGVLAVTNEDTGELENIRIFQRVNQDEPPTRETAGHKAKAKTTNKAPAHKLNERTD